MLEDVGRDLKLLTRRQDYNENDSKKSFKMTTTDPLLSFNLQKERTTDWKLGL